MVHHIRLSGSADHNQNLDGRTILKSGICIDSDSLLRKDCSCVFGYKDTSGMEAGKYLMGPHKIQGIEIGK